MNAEEYNARCKVAVDVLHNGVSDKDARIAELEAKNASLTAQMGDATAEVGRQKSIVESLQKDIRALDASKGELASHYGYMVLERDEYEAKLAETKKRLEDTISLLRKTVVIRERQRLFNDILKAENEALRTTHLKDGVK